ncbi:hypothetical protein HAP48_0035250 [Bradyrhizobium septentrionale]|uniref:Uncharacterized protein n=1 Tax=Bradyrhizobium septentrionale TaxID=1404411 RepID=A0A974A277_9BRAD|nr:hypothetical protein [Bradyrhizobium septentrionale]UGY13792.1 hypothetical protein HAP48_0035250 [Bradyrhizobium septentrionale]
MQRTAEALPEMRLDGESVLHEAPHRIDRPPPGDHLARPAYGDSSRDAIKAIVVGISEQNGKALAALRAELDELEQLMLISAAKVQHEIDGHASICRYVHEEVGRLHGVVGKMRQQQSEIVHVADGEHARASA